VTYIDQSSAQQVLVGHRTLEQHIPEWRGCGCCSNNDAEHSSRGDVGGLCSDLQCDVLYSLVGLRPLFLVNLSHPDNTLIVYCDGSSSYLVSILQYTVYGLQLMNARDDCERFMISNSINSSSTWFTHDLVFWCNSFYSIVPRLDLCSSYYYHSGWEIMSCFLIRALV
jgi:hypothetical protein